MENKILINKAINYIQKNPKDNLSLQSIADNAGFSLTYFDAMFRRHTGYSPVEYSRVYKLTRSALELRRTEKSVIEIALDFGYASPESFARAFKNFYSMSPSEYRDKYSRKAVVWQDLSGKIAISHFKRSFPELKTLDIDTALDYCFTHNVMRFAEDIIGMTVGDVEVLTMGNCEVPKHFIYVSDYNEPEAFVNIVCENEADAVFYVKLLERNPKVRFTIRKPIDEDWDMFDGEIARLGLVCKSGYDMIFPFDKIEVPENRKMVIRELTAEDMSAIKVFKAKGGCGECHVRSLQTAFERKGNLGERGFGLFINGEMICLGLPVADAVRDFKKYDIGGIFAVGDGGKGEALEMMWKYIIDVCIKDGALVGNANAKEDMSPICVDMSERVGLIKAAKCCSYSR